MPPLPPYPFGAQSAPINLASDTRAQENAILGAQSSTVRASLLAASSRYIEQICKRIFGLTSYQVYLSGGGQPYDLVRLDNFPVSQITRMASYPLPVLTVQNTATSTNQRATVDTMPTGINLTTVASGVSSTSTLLYATYPTLTTLAAAITALGSGWTATASSSYTLYPSADLRPLQGAVTALQGSGAQLEAYTEDIYAWGGPWFDSGNGYGLVCSGPGWRLDADSGQLVGWFPRGMLNIRVDYSAGYSTSPDSLPDDIQDACVKGAAFLYGAGRYDPVASSVQIGPYKQSNQVVPPDFKKFIMSLISTRIDHSKTIGWMTP